MTNSTYLLSILILFIFQISNGQEITGIATYKAFMKFDLELDSTKVNDDMRDRLKQILNQQTQKEYELYFSNNESVFKEKEKLETPGSNVFGNSTVSVSGGFGSFYNNLRQKRFVNQFDLYSKLFLVSDTLENQDWKLEKETKSIGEYVCFKAIRMRISENEETGEKKETLITAWYTPQIPVSLGPSLYRGLPGLILEVQDGDFTYLCSQIVLNPKNGVTIAPAKKGTKVSQKEYDRIQKKKNKEMEERSDFPGDKSIQIRVGG